MAIMHAYRIEAKIYVLYSGRKVHGVSSHPPAKHWFARTPPNQFALLILMTTVRISVRNF